MSIFTQQYNFNHSQIQKTVSRYRIKQDGNEMRTIRTKVYSFDELSKPAQQKAIEWYKTILNNDSDLLEFYPEYCKEVAKEEGFEDITVQYSLSNCQGDGLSFKCETLDIERMIKEAIPNVKQSVVKAIKGNCSWYIKGNTGHYCYAAKSDVDFYLDVNKDYPNIENAVTIVREYIENQYMALCKELEKNGYAEIDYRYTDESIIDTIVANEYEFTKDGNRF